MKVIKRDAVLDVMLRELREAQVKNEATLAGLKMKSKAITACILDAEVGIHEVDRLITYLDNMDRNPY